MTTSHPSTCFIVNPTSASGRTGKSWAKTAAVLEQSLSGFSVKMTSAPLDAIRLTREALREGHELIVSVGGDGTNNEVVNGFFDEQGEYIQPNAMFSFFPSGTGGDLRRTLVPASTPQQLADMILCGTCQDVDLGCAEVTLEDGSRCKRFFINIASFGLSGAVNENVRKTTKLLGGTIAFYIATVRAILGYNKPVVSLELEGGEEGTRTETGRISTVAVSNCTSFGGGMRVAPHALPDDGLFDVVTLGDFGRFGLIIYGTKIYAGTHLSLKHVSDTQAHTVKATVLEPKDQRVMIDLDGENVGQLPASFSILPKKLKFRHLPTS
ncbi:MAG: diacylglycerol kinase [Deltaproteobacteria bacterium]|nr:diacylglycerol kinase [Deltaproteobacteria bacterium]|tara:strand:+ start:3825 stop:4796 length:972 start_codon:yes stop_codon:yes gene_type:complete